MSSDNTATAASSTEVPPVYRTPEGLRTLANYLRSHVRVKSGVEFDKRVDYFKGFRLVECILEGKKWPKSLPRVEDKETAIQLGDLLIEGNFFHRSEKIKGKKRYLKLCDKRNFEEKGHFTWMFSGNMMWSNLATGLIIVAVIGFTLLPIWPDAAKKILWYLSVTFLIATVAFCLVRFLLFLLLWILGFDFWIFPRLFDETLSVKDSFIPLYSFDKGSAGQGAYRLGMVALLAASTYWAISQPTAFDSFVQAQSDFVSDLYSGKLLADVAFDPRDHLDRNKRVPSLEDLLKELENDEKSITDKPREGGDNENDSEAAERRAGEAEGETETETEGNPFEHDEE